MKNVISILLLLSFCHASTAFACSIDESYFPGGGIMVPDDGQLVPANLPGIFFSTADPAKSVVLDANGNVVAQTIDGNVAKFDADLEFGKEYRVFFDGSEVNRFRTGSKVSHPTTFGELTVSEQAVTEPISDDCDAPGEKSVVYRYVELNDSGFESWRNAMVFATFIDGSVQPTIDIGYPGVVRAACVGNPVGVLTEGSHTMKVVGVIPGTDVQIESNTLHFDLDCDGDTTGCSMTNPTTSNLFLVGLLFLLFYFRRRKQTLGQSLSSKSATLVVLVSSSFLLQLPEALACSPDEFVSPISGFVLPRFGEVPANVPGT